MVINKKDQIICKSHKSEEFSKDNMSCLETEAENEGGGRSLKPQLRSRLLLCMTESQDLRSRFRVPDPLKTTAQLFVQLDSLGACPISEQHK